VRDQSALTLGCELLFPIRIQEFKPLVDTLYDYMNKIFYFLTYFMFSANLASAQVEDLSCFGIKDQFVSKINATINKIENAVNEKMDTALQFFNFEKGNDQFKIAGGLKLGRFTAPKFNCKEPTKFHESGIGDFGIKPEFPIDATLFGKTVNVLTVGMEMGQDQRNKKPGTNPTGDEANEDAPDGLGFNVMVFGVNVLSKERRGAAINAVVKDVKNFQDEFQAQSGPSSFTPKPPAETTGDTQKLVDINKSLADIGAKIIVPLIAGVNLVVDAGFTFTIDLTYFYGLDAGLLKLSGGGQIKGKKKSETPAQICSAPKGGSTISKCDNKNARGKAKGGDFFSRFEKAQKDEFEVDVNEQVENFKNIQESVKDLQTAAMKQDMKALKEKYVLLFESLEYAEPNYKKMVIDGLDFSKELRPERDKDNKSNDSGIDFSEYTADDYLKIAAAAANLYASIQATYDSLKGAGASIKKMAGMLNGFPAVEAKAGTGVDIRLAAWVQVTLTFDFAVAKAYAGLQGTFVPLDAKIQLALKYKTTAQYLNLVVQWWVIRMQGNVSAIAGIEVGFGEKKWTKSWDKILIEFPGNASKKELLIARLDFKKQPHLFWCTSLPWINNPIDAERCEDGDVSQDSVKAELANHIEFRKKVLGEHVPDYKDNCFLHDDAGQVFYSTSDSSVCSAMLPSGNTSLSPVSGKPHPLQQMSLEKPDLFMAYVRTDSNYPVIKLQKSTSSGTTVQAYTATHPVIDPLTTTPDGNGIYPVPDPFIFSQANSPNPSISDRILTPTTFGALIQSHLDGSPMPINAKDELIRRNANFQINTGNTMGSASSKLVVTDLPALNNAHLIQFARDFKLGLCQVRDIEVSGTLKRALYVANAPYPTNGNDLGLAEVNRTDVEHSKLGCSAAGNESEYLGCWLRKLIVSGECFPPERMMQLIALGNLSDEQVIDYFFGTPKRIKGSLAAGDAEWGWPNAGFQSDEIFMPTVPSGGTSFNDPAYYAVPYGSLKVNGGVYTTDNPVEIREWFYQRTRNIPQSADGASASCKWMIAEKNQNFYSDSFEGPSNIYPFIPSPWRASMPNSILYQQGNYYSYDNDMYLLSSSIPADYPHWFMSYWGYQTDTFTWNAFDQVFDPTLNSSIKVKFHSRSRAIQYAIEGDIGGNNNIFKPQAGSNLLTLNQTDGALKGVYNINEPFNDPIDGNSPICNTNHPYHYYNFFNTSRQSLLQNPPRSGVAAHQLASAIKQCVSQAKCTFIPETLDVYQSQCEGKFILSGNATSITPMPSSGSFYVNGPALNNVVLDKVFSEVFEPSSFHDCKMKVKGFADSKDVCQAYKDLLVQKVNQTIVGSSTIVQAAPGPASAVYSMKAKVKLKWSESTSGGSGTSALTFDQRQEEHEVAECHFTYVHGSNPTNSSVNDIMGAAIGIEDAQPGACQLTIFPTATPMSSGIDQLLSGAANGPLTGGDSGGSGVQGQISSVPMLDGGTRVESVDLPAVSCAPGYTYNPATGACQTSTEGAPSGGLSGGSSLNGNNFVALPNGSVVISSLDPGAFIVQHLSSSRDVPIDNVQMCRDALGFNNTVVRNVFVRGLRNQDRLNSVCSKLSSAQAVEIQKRFNLDPNATQFHFLVKAKYISPVTFSEQSLTLGTCTMTKIDLGTKLAGGACHLKVIRTSSTDPHFVDLNASDVGNAYVKMPVNLPGIPEGLTPSQAEAEALNQFNNRAQLCKTAIANRFFTPAVAGTSPVNFAAARPLSGFESCPSRFLQRPEILGLGGGKAFKVVPVLGNEEIGAPYACGGNYSSTNSLLAVGSTNAANGTCKLSLKSTALVTPTGNPSLTTVNLGNNTNIPLAETTTAQSCHAALTGLFDELGASQNPETLCHLMEDQTSVPLYMFWGGLNGGGNTPLGAAANFTGGASGGTQTWSHDPSQGAGPILSMEIGGLHAPTSSYLPVHTCTYEFKKTNRSFRVVSGVTTIDETWEIKPSSYVSPFADVTEGIEASAKSVGLCLRAQTRNPQTGQLEATGGCVAMDSTKRVIVGGMDSNVIATLDDPAFVPDQAYFQNLCSTKLPDLEPVSESVQVDPLKRYPLYILSQNQQKPNLLSPAAHYCAVPKCELRAGFGYEYMLADSAWKAKNTITPRTQSECVQYYQSKWQDHCARVEFLRQLPRNMPIEMIVDFEGFSQPLGKCTSKPAPNASCRIVMQNISSRLQSSQNHVIKTVNLNREPVVTGGPKSHPKVVNRPNSLDECHKYGVQLYREKDLCLTPSSSVNKNIPYEIAARLGEMTLPIKACSVASLTVVDGTGNVVGAPPAIIVDPSQGEQVENRASDTQSRQQLDQTLTQIKYFLEASGAFGTRMVIQSDTVTRARQYHEDLSTLQTQVSEGRYGEVPENTRQVMNEFLGHLKNVMGATEARETPSLKAPPVEKEAVDYKEESQNNAKPIELFKPTAGDSEAPLEQQKD
jgi:hypothetical protein